MKISFLGAAKQVTGSNYLITTDKYKFLIDCGLYQGTPTEEKLNTEEFSFDPSEIDFMLLTHAHIDHSGRIPLLVKHGYKGKIYSTYATKDLAEILMEDSGKIHEADAAWENKKRERAGLELVKPLYTSDDAVVALQYFYPVKYDELIHINEDISFKLNNAGHLLGSAIIELWINSDGRQKKLVFSGDLGMREVPMLNPPTMIKEADFIIVESTYGNRNHNNLKDRVNNLLKIIIDTAEKGGTTIIPSFAVGRTQEIIFELLEYAENQELKEKLLKIPIYADSPMAIEATGLFVKNSDSLNNRVREYIDKGKDFLKLPNLVMVKDMKESIKLNTKEGAKVIISASGMCDAGRIKHHLKHYLWKDTTSIIFVGYQAFGTLGRDIKEGKELVNILDSDVKVSANVYTVEGFSGHADKDDLINWLKGFKEPQKVFIVHGEEEVTREFSQNISDTLGFSTYIPSLGEEIEI